MYSSILSFYSDFKDYIMPSDIWKFFEKPIDGQAKCKKCGKGIKMGKSSSTKALWDHLNSCSPSNYKKFHPAEMKKKDAIEQHKLEAMGFKNTTTDEQKQQAAEEMIAAILQFSGCSRSSFIH